MARFMRQAHEAQEYRLGQRFGFNGFGLRNDMSHGDI